jgi:uncharacterized protein YkwD
MQNSKFTLSVLATAMTLALAACGGGGGDDGGAKNPTTPPTTPTTPVTPEQPASIPPATSAPSPTYPAADERLVAYDTLNNVRLAMGVGVLRQDDKLDTAASNHLDYIKANGLSHTEIAGKQGYTGDTPYDQVVAAGGSKDQWIGQTALSGSPTGTTCVETFKNSIYHLQAITGNQETVGIAVRDNRCVLNFGLVTGAKGNGYGLPQWGGQQMASSAVAYYPTDGANVLGSFTPAAESPNPAPDLTMAGRPVMFRVAAPEATDMLTVSSFTLSGPGGVAIPARVLVPTNAKAGSISAAVEDVNLWRGVVFLLPTQQLPAGTYSATFAGARNGVAISKTWSFTTF